MSGARILAVDDDKAILLALRRALERSGYNVRALATASGVIDALAEFRPDVLLLDLVLPDGDGIEVCRRVRERSDVPVIVLSALGDNARKVRALDLGADDYLTKPFSMNELEARIRVALRRSAGAAGSTVLTAGALRLDVTTREVSVGGFPVHLTPREFDLCRFLLQQRGRVLTQRQILAAVWGPEYGNDSHILRTFVHQLRTKLYAAMPGSGSLTRPAYRAVSR